MLAKFLVYIILFMLMVISILAFSLHEISDDRDYYKDKVNLILATAKENKRKYDGYIKSYNNAITSIVKFYDDEKDDVKNFKRGANETECQAANRLFKRTKY